VNDPSVVRLANGTYYMFYTGTYGEDDKNEIGLATSDNPYANFTKCASNPVLACGYNSQEYWVARPSVIYENGLFKMWYDTKSGPYNWTGIGYATSPNGTVWDRWGIVLPSNVGYGNPTVIHEGNHYRMMVNTNRTTVPVERLDIFFGNETQWILMQKDVIPASSAAWHTTGVDTPYLFQNSSNTLLYFVGGNGTFGSSWRIGLATENIIRLGDFNGDHKVNFDDLATFVALYVSSRQIGGTVSPYADFNYDGVINVDDLLLFVISYVDWATTEAS
jgi:hypothetical protein